MVLFLWLPLSSCVVSEASTSEYSLVEASNSLSTQLAKHKAHDALYVHIMLSNIALWH